MNIKIQHYRDNHDTKKKRVAIHSWYVISCARFKHGKTYPSQSLKENSKIPIGSCMYSKLHIGYIRLPMIMNTCSLHFLHFVRATLQNLFGPRKRSHPITNKHGKRKPCYFSIMEITNFSGGLMWLSIQVSLNHWNRTILETHVRDQSPHAISYPQASLRFGAFSHNCNAMEAWPVKSNPCTP